MRTLPLEGIFPNDQIKTLSIMLAPNDEAFQRSFYASHYVIGYEMDLRGSHLVSSNLLHDLLHAPSYADLKPQIADRTKRAYLAGLALTVMFLCWKFPEMMGKRIQGGASLGKAIHACTWIARQDGFKYGDADPLPVSAPTVRKAWQEFSDVAHLWAAKDWNHHHGGKVPQDKFLSVDHYVQTFRTARAFESFSQILQPFDRGTKTASPIVNPDTVWRIPDKFSAALTLSVDSSVYTSSRIGTALRNYMAS